MHTAARDLKLTPDHLLLGGSCEHYLTLTLVRADSLAPGHCLQTEAGREVLTAVAQVRGRGVYTVVPLAADKLLVVNGVVASPFAGNHALANAWYSLHRALHRALPGTRVSPLLLSALDVFGGMVTKTLNYCF
jgi:hypothetical protein